MIDIDLSGMAYGGEALGRLPDGRAVFVPHALAGERVRIEPVSEKRGHVKARLVEVLQASPLRIAPRCPHFGLCGGCHYQFLPYREQLAVKTRVFTEQLQRLAGIAAPPVQPIVASPAAWNYRNAVQFHLDPAGKPGYQEAQSHRVLPIRECSLPEEAINETWPLLDLVPIPGLERIELRSGSDGEILINFESRSNQPPEMELDLPVSVVHQGPDGPLLMAGDDFITIEVLKRSFHVSAGSFFQVNSRQAAALASHLDQVLPLDQQTTLLDVYCGVGLFSALLAPRVKRLVGVEVSPSACDDFALNLDEFDHVELYTGAAEEILPHLNLHPDVIIVDPPRAGLDRQALDAIVGMNPRTLAYVSCDPATLSRDLRRLGEAGYHLHQVTPFDLFPQTYHIESVSILHKQ